MTIGLAFAIAALFHQPTSATPADPRSGVVVPVVILASDATGLRRLAIRNAVGVTRQVRAFFARETGLDVPGYRVTVIESAATSRQWQDWAESTDHDLPGLPLDRHRYLDQVLQELKRSDWHGNRPVDGAKSIVECANRGKVRVVVFVALDADAIGSRPSGLGAISVKSIAVAAPLSATARPRDADFDDSFYGVAHELGHAFGLPHTDKYGRKLPTGWERSVMYQGDGTRSLLLAHERQALTAALRRWRR